MSRLSRFCALIALLIPTLPAVGQQDVQPSLKPGDLIARAIARDAYGPATLSPGRSLLVIQVDGADAPGADFLIPVAPGETATLLARVEPLQPLQPPRPAPATSIRQTRHEELLWWAPPGTELLPVGDRTVAWKAPADSAGEPVTVSDAYADLSILRPAVTGFSPDEAAQAPFSTGEASITLLPGIPYQRDSDGLLLGVNIGIYPLESGERAPASVRDRQELYRPPTSFHRLTAATAGLLVTPTRTLGDLHPNPLGGDPPELRLVPLSGRLLTWLSAFEGKLQEKGFNPDRLRVVRGFVSPTERLRLRGRGESLAEFSRFLYGDAVALVYTDNDAPRMGDFNGDGGTSLDDVQALGDLAKETMDALQMYGGLGICSRFPGDGPAKDSPYLHIDLRGFYTPFRE